MFLLQCCSSVLLAGVESQYDIYKDASHFIRERLDVKIHDITCTTLILFAVPYDVYFYMA